MSVLEISRIDRENQTYTLATLFPGLTGPFTAASIALLPPRTGPTSATVWTTVTVASGVASVLFAGPDADSTGAVVVTGNCDVWVKTTVGSQTATAKAGRINLASGGSVVIPPTAALDAAIFTVLNDSTSASYAKVEALIAARAGFGGLATP